MKPETSVVVEISSYKISHLHVFWAAQLAYMGSSPTEDVIYNKKQKVKIN
jgi:hypothetical protein